MPHNLHTIAVPAVPEPLDPLLARRLALRAESSAASCKAWASILIYRLTNSRPMSDSGKAAGADVCRRVSEEARDFIAAVEALGALLGSSKQGGTA